MSGGFKEAELELEVDLRFRQFLGSCGNSEDAGADVVSMVIEISFKVSPQ